MNGDENPLPFGFVLHHAGDFGKNGPILPYADVFTGVNASSFLADQNGAAQNGLAGEPFYSQSLAVGIATVFGTAYAFLMCHIFSSNLSFQYKIFGQFCKTKKVPFTTRFGLEIAGWLHKFHL